jgi:transketolase
MRTSFINQLIIEARNNSKVFLIVGDLGYSVVEAFAKEFPDRYLNTGVAEQNMIGIATGVALEGFIPFVYSIANFPTLRCLEQIRYEACYHNLNIKIVAVGGGYAYGSLGASHHATEEIGIMRALPNIVVCSPGDPIETKSIVKNAVNNNHPFYIRLGKAGEPLVHQKDIETIIGDIIPVIEGNKTAVISTGAMLKYASDFILSNQINASLYSLPYIKPINKKHLIKIFNKYNKIITIEEHQASCGMGSAILECLNDLQNEHLIKQIPLIKRIAIPDKFINIAGSQDYLREVAGLTLKLEYFI